MKTLRFALALSLAISCSPTPPSAGEVSADTGSLVRSNTAFALDLYRELRTTEGNLFFSPYSISTALAMTYGGARGKTADEMEQTLHFALDQDRLHPAFAKSDKRLGAIRNKGDLDLLVANSLWPQVDYPFREEYLALARQHYGAPVTPVDYSGATEEARKTINHWVEGKTRDRIRDLIRRGDLDPATMLVLVNAIYFKGDWAHQFDESRTYTGSFVLPGGEEKDVRMMTQQGSFKYGEHEQVQVIELPYAGDDLAMFVVLPRSGYHLSDVEDSLTQENLLSWLSSLSPSEVEVSLPEFSITWGTEDLTDHLQALGMKEAFLIGRADFSGMDGSRSLFMGSVLHKAFIEVNEEGSEASASTAVVIKGLSSRTLNFRADHPFLFLIRDNTTGTILFLGRLVDPL
ncbi:MAG: serpin family protein [Candidatus Eisenbacteria sp.]|nr:serpin family protein [Candidatus Eisenbacteria bacterium]